MATKNVKAQLGLSAKKFERKKRANACTCIDQCIVVIDVPSLT